MDEQRVIEALVLPEGDRLNGYREHDVQDLILQLREKSNKRGVNNKQFLAAMDNEYLTKVLAAA